MRARQDAKMRCDAKLTISPPKLTKVFSHVDVRAVHVRVPRDENVHIKLSLQVGQCLDVSPRHDLVPVAALLLVVVRRDELRERGWDRVGLGGAGQKSRVE